MNLFKQKIKKTLETIFLILLILYFAKTLWINIISYDKVEKIPRLNIEMANTDQENDIFSDNINNNQ